MTFDEQNDPYDPVVADRFELLDRLTPPPAPPEAASMDALAPAKPVVGPGGGRRWPRYTLIGVAAAAVLTLVGVSAIAFTGDGDQGLEATEVGPADGDDEAGAGQDDATDPSVTSSTLRSSTVTEGTPIVVEDTSTDDGSDYSLSTTTAPTSSGSDPTTDTTVPTTIEDPSTSSTAGSDGPGEIVTISGMLTEVFTDCQSRLVLNEAGEVEEVGPVSCDGGSHIVVDGRRIQTTSGFGLPEDAFDKHPKGLQPGRSVVVTAISRQNGWLSLDCGQCGVGR